MSEKLTIGKLASATGTKVETIRYYEQIGLLPAPARSAGNYRTYEGEHLRRLSFIRRARDLGFSIDQVRELMGLAGRREQSCMAVDVIGENSPESTIVFEPYPSDHRAVLASFTVPSVK